MSKPFAFPEQLARKLLVLEEYFHNRTLTLESVNELVSTYVQSVQQFDFSENQLRYYFVQKIQFLLSRPEVIEILAGNGNSFARETLHNIRDTIRGTITPQNVKYVNPVYEKSKKHKHNLEEEIKYDEELKKKERSAKVQMYVDVEKEMKLQVPEIKAEFKKQMETGEKIKDMIANQQSSIKDRLMKRRNKKQRKSAQKSKEDMVELPQLSDLKQMQQEISENVTRFTVRMTGRTEERKAKQETSHNTVIRATKNGGRITIRNDDDD